MKVTNYILMLLLSCCFFSSEALAYTCKNLSFSTTITPPPMVIQRDLPVGSVIGSLALSPNIQTYDCGNDSGEDISIQTFGLRGTGNYVKTINGRRIFSTNIPGIGFSLGMNATNSCQGILFISNGDSLLKSDPNTLNICASGKSGYNYPLTATAVVQFYKISDLTGSGVVNSQQIGSIYLYTNHKYLEKPETFISFSSFNVTTVACNVTNPVITVPMGDVDKRSFSGPGSWPKDSNTKSFSIPLNCDSNAKIKVKFEGDINDASKGILNLSGGEGSASGVGVQLLYRDVPLALSKQVDIGQTSADGFFAIPLKARYLQLINDISPGVANSNVTFTITYQ